MTAREQPCTNGRKPLAYRDNRPFVEMRGVGSPHRSIRDTVPSPPLATHTLPAPVAIP
jgi:hypothetical protein